jgi:hypothetical protein
VTTAAVQPCDPVVTDNATLNVDAMTAMRAAQLRSS